ncbi:MAG: hypothetical protein ACOCXA_04020 [Planctomycetota bacterium]
MLLFVLLLGVAACSGGGGALQPNQIDALGLSRSNDDPVAQQLLQRADSYYRLYRDSGGSGYYDQHVYAVEGVVQRLMLQQKDAAQESSPSMEPESLPQWPWDGMPAMPTELDADSPLLVPMGTA